MSVSKSLSNSSPKPLGLFSLIVGYMGIMVIDLYRISFAGLFGGRCRFQPSCSCYAREAFLVFGPWKGFVKMVCRLSRCHPWGSHGYDPVIKNSDKGMP